MVGRHQRNGTASGPGRDGSKMTIPRSSLAILLTLAIISGILIPLIAGGIKVVTGDFIPGIIMLLFAGFIICVSAGWLNKRYQGQLVVLGISLLVIMGIIWAIVEDGYGPKAFMLSLVVTAGLMAALGFYNVFLKKRQPHMPG